MSEITPDTKDWTWVLERPCPECGFVAAELPATEVAAVVRASVPRWQEVLARPDVRTRPRPDVWSPLEYACHVRDVYRIFATRVRLMLAEDSPTFDNWDQDATAVAERYAEQDPAAVSVELAEAGEDAASAFDGVPTTRGSASGCAATARASRSRRSASTSCTTSCTTSTTCPADGDASPVRAHIFVHRPVHPRRFRWSSCG